MPNASTLPHRSAAHAAHGSTTVDRLARVGLLALGIVHVLIGWIALQLVVGDSSDQADNQGALKALADTPVGGPLLWLIVVGLVGLVVWQLAEALIGAADDDGAKRTAKRALAAGKALLYGALAWSAAKIASGSGSGSSDTSGETFSAKLMEAPAGPLLVGLVGGAVIGAGAWFIRKGITQRFRNKLDAGATAGRAGTALIRLGIAGHVGKGAALGILGGLFIVAAVEHDPERSGGLDDALKTLLGQPGGEVLVVLVGLGLAAYGAYCVGWARHMRRA